MPTTRLASALYSLTTTLLPRYHGKGRRWLLHCACSSRCVILPCCTLSSDVALAGASKSDATAKAIDATATASTSHPNYSHRAKRAWIIVAAASPSKEATDLIKPTFDVHVGMPT